MATLTAQAALVCLIAGTLAGVAGCGSAAVNDAPGPDPGATGDGGGGPLGLGTTGDDAGNEQSSDARSGTRDAGLDTSSGLEAGPAPGLRKLVDDSAITSFALDQNDVYYVTSTPPPFPGEQGDSVVMMIAKGGGQPIPVLSLPSRSSMIFTSIYVDADVLAVVESHNVASEPSMQLVTYAKGSTTPIFLASGPYSITGVVLDGTYAYWTQDGSGSLLRSPKLTPSPSPIVLGNGTTGAFQPMLDSSYLYWQRRSTATGIIDVARAGKDGSNVVSLGSFPANTVGACALYGAGVLCTEHVANYPWDPNGTVVEFDTPGGAGTPFATGQGTPTGIATSGTTAFWANAGTATDAGASASDGAIVRCGTPAGSVTPLVTGRTQGTGIATDGASIYFIDRGLWAFDL
jgi:hypothetical protein